MDIRDNVRFQLAQARNMTQSVLDSFQDREDWLYQPHDRANHALWVAMHLAMADNFMASQLRPELDNPVDERWKERYWFGSTPSRRDEDNIDVQQALDYMADRRKALLECLESMSDEKLAAPLPDDSPFAQFPNRLHVFLFNAQHEGIHFGQLTVAHRGLGRDPVYQPEG